MSTALKLAASALLITGLGVGIDVTPALAANSGCGSACDGENPAAYTLDYDGSVITCSLDAETKKTNSYSADEPAISLRYSPRCRTAWARTEGYDYFIYVYSYNTNGTLRRVESTFVEGGANYTLMVNDAGYTAKACIGDWPGTDSELTCTAKY